MPENMKTIFITGTDTDVGKTYITVSLLQQFNAENLKTFAIKPIASGCEPDSSGKLINADALALQQAASIKKPYATINPFAFREPIAPHLAAKNAGIKLSVADLTAKITSAIQPQADINLIEGVGGWSVPLNDHELLADMVYALGIPVILVIAIKLGYLNHAILTHNNIKQMNIPLLGWVANCIEPDMLAAQVNIQTLNHWISAPCLGVVGYGAAWKYNRNNFNLSC